MLSALLANDHAESKFVILLHMVEFSREDEVDTHVDPLLEISGDLQSYHIWLSSISQRLTRCVSVQMQ